MNPHLLQIILFRVYIKKLRFTLSNYCPLYEYIEGSSWRLQQIKSYDIFPSLYGHVLHTVLSTEELEQCFESNLEMR